MGRTLNSPATFPGTVRTKSKAPLRSAASPLSENVEMYLETVYILTEQGGKARTTAIARDWKVAPSSATEMIQRLAAGGLLKHEPYKGVELTRRGMEIARGVIRKHRLLECFLLRDVGMNARLADAHACEMEHVIHPMVEEWLCERMGHPEKTPGEARIPAGACCPKRV